MAHTKFHLALPVTDLTKTRAFYAETLGFAEGRSTDHWVDFNMFGHQLVLHLTDVDRSEAVLASVDGTSVPVPHFGVLLGKADWCNLRNRLEDAGTQFIVKPQVRFEGEACEQCTMFFLDPSNNALEVKSFKDDTQVFAT